MQSWYLLGPTSSDGGGGLFLPSSKHSSLLKLGRSYGGRCRRPAPPPPGAGGGGGEQDHYAVLGITRSASAVEVKRAYRLLARKFNNIINPHIKWEISRDYDHISIVEIVMSGSQIVFKKHHPDVSRQLQADELFKSIRLAYEVLSDEVTRANYDTGLKLAGTVDEPWRARWTEDAESDERRRARRWAAKVRQRMQNEQDPGASWYDQRDIYNKKYGFEGGSFTEVLQSAFLTLLFMRIVGHRVTLAFCSLAACFDRQLDAGYKMGYVLACFLGGQGGILLALCIQFTSWLLGKNSSSHVAMVVLATWVATNLAKFVPLPQGAVLALLYMSIKLQVDSK